MNISLRPGTYVIAVSGGVDSMVLLDLLAGQEQSESNSRPVRLVVAHFDHGIRPDSESDRLFVQQAAKDYGLPFVFDQVKLGPKASEAASRTARYKFLEEARRAANAAAIVTAHHQDDLIETAFINTIRGTGRRGLTALCNRPTLLRPLLGIPKSKLVSHAKANGLNWREDSTNTDLRFLRNHIRQRLIPTLDPNEQDQLVHDLTDLGVMNDQIDQLIANHLHTQPANGQLSRQWFIMLPHAVACEIMIAWLRAHDVIDLNKKQLTVLTTKAKTLAPGKRIVVTPTHTIKVGKHKLALAVAER